MHESKRLFEVRSNDEKLYLYDGMIKARRRGVYVKITLWNYRLQGYGFKSSGFSV